MFDGFRKFWRGVMRMFGYTTLKNIVGKDITLSDSMINAINDWKNMMNAHQSAGSLAVLVTAAALSSTKLENLMSNLFPNETTKILGLIIVSQLMMLRLMTFQYNIIKLTGMIKRIPAYIGVNELEID